MAIATDSTWDESKEPGKAQDASHSSVSTDLMGLGGLLGQISTSYSGRNIPEVSEVEKLLTETFTARKSSDLHKLKAQIIPNVNVLDANISPVLPGLVLSLFRGNNVFVLPILFWSKAVLLDAEDVTFGASLYNPQVSNVSGILSVPRVPASYMDKAVTQQLGVIFRDGNQSKNVVVIGSNVINLEMYSPEQRRDPKRFVTELATRIDIEWETSIMVEIARDYGRNKKPLDNVFNDQSAYGPNRAAQARIQPIDRQIGIDGIISPANMEVSIVTTNPNARNYNSPENAPKMVCTANANVTLLPFPYRSHIANLQRMQRPNLGGGMRGVTQDGWAPFRPCISLVSSLAGPQMNSNGGLVPFIFSLFALMCANNNYAFAEVLRRQKCGVRGSFIDLEPRLIELFRENQVTRPVGGPSVKMDNKSILDHEAINQWIRAHIMPTAIFTVPILPTNFGSALTKWFVELNDATKRGEAVSAFISTINSITNNRFTEQVQLNAQNQKGWKLGDAIFHNSPQLIIDGTAYHNGELFNLGELDEQSVFHMAGPSGANNASLLLRTMYYPADQRENDRVRQQRIRQLLADCLNLTDININAIGRVGVMDPNLMHLLGTLMTEIGTLSTAAGGNNLVNGQAVFAPGTGLAVDFAAGVDNSMGIVAGFDPYNVV